MLVFNTKLGHDEITRRKPGIDDETGEVIEINAYSDEEILDNEIMVLNNIVTNLLFNMGYMYSDIMNYFNLEHANINYWSNVGLTIGDFMVRFLFKEDF